MEELLRHELLAKTKQALDADDWNAVVRLWQPWVEQGDAEAEYQLAYHYLWCTPCDDDTKCDQMKELLRRASAKNHPDAIWFLATRELGAHETSPEFKRELLRAGQLERDPMIACRRRAAQDHGSAIEVFDNHIDPAVVEQIAKGRAAGDSRFSECGSG